MELVYIGFFSRIFQWVLSNIFDPVYRFVSSLLTTVFAWVFNEVLAPILMPILKDVMNFAIELWLRLHCTELFVYLSGALKIVDHMETAFDVFIGLSDVTYQEPGGEVLTGSLVDVLMQQKTFSTVFWIITLGGLGLALMLTVYATAKSAFDLDFENKRPVSKVLAAMMKTFVQFFTVPFLVYFLVKLSALILKGVTSALSFGGTTSLGRIVFVISSMDAAHNPEFNVSTMTNNITLGTSPADTVRYPFYAVGAEGVNSLDYWNLSHVTANFDLFKIDFVIGYIAAVFLLFTIGVCLIVFVQRIFEILLLYLVSPYFVCTMPLDDGEKFSKWREMFVAKCFSGFGSAIGMRLFLLVCPMIMGGRIKFGTSSPEMDYMIKLFFLIGGAWAVYKSGPMITTLLNFHAGQTEAGTAALAGGFLFSQTAGRAIAKGKGALMSGAGRLGRHGGGAGPAGRGSAFTGSKADAAKPGRFTGSAGKAGSVGKRGAGGNQTWRNGISGTRRGLTERSGVKSGVQIGAYRDKDGSFSKAAAAIPKMDVKPQHSTSLGRLYSNTYDDQGNRKFRILGMGFTQDYKGRTTSYTLPGLSLRKGVLSGNLSVSHAKLPGIMDIHTNIEGGKLKYTDISLPGMDYSSTREGVSVSGGLGSHAAHYNSNKDGAVFGVGGSFSMGMDSSGAMQSFHAGQHSFSTSKEGGMSYRYGSHFNMSTDRADNLTGVKIGGLNYQRSGVIARGTGEGQEGKK